VFGIYENNFIDESSSPGADDPASLLILRRTGYLIDADRTTLSFDPEALEGRFSTGYPIETYL
jgi:hypothetical protein